MSIHGGYCWWNIAIKDNKEEESGLKESVYNSNKMKKTRGYNR